MHEASFGRIVMTTSSSGLYGLFGQANAAAAKMALVEDDAPTRAILCAGAGHFAAAHVTLTAGLQAPRDDAGEHVIAHWPAPVDRTCDIVPAYGFIQAEREVAAASAKV